MVGFPKSCHILFDFNLCYCIRQYFQAENIHGFSGCSLLQMLSHKYMAVSIGI